MIRVVRTTVAQQLHFETGAVHENGWLRGVNFMKDRSRGMAWSLVMLFAVCVLIMPGLASRAAAAPDTHVAWKQVGAVKGVEVRRKPVVSHHNTTEYDLLHVRFACGVTRLRIVNRTQ
jgi:hypothetical protein